MKFRSKIDWWLLLIFIVITANIIMKIYEANHNYSLASNFPHLIIYSLIIFVIWLPIFNTYYVVENNTLIIKSLVFRWKSGSGCGHALWHREGCLRSSGRDVGRRLASSLS